MAQDLLADFNALHNQPANALGNTIAGMVLRGGHRMIRFPPSEARAAYFKRILPRLYNGLGITVNLVYTWPTTTGTAQFNIAFERHEAGFLYTGDSFASAKVITLAAPSVANGAAYASLAFADGSEIDSLVALEEFRLSVARVATDGNAQVVYLSNVFLTNTG